MPRDFDWSTQNYSVRDIIYSLAERLPLIVRVTEGYCSNDYFHDFGAEQVLRVYDVTRQERVVVRESGGRYLSIPCSYPDRVCINYHDGRAAKEMSMASVTNVIRKHSRCNFSILLANDRSIQTVNQHSGEEAAASDFGVLQPINVYQEPYLVAHTIDNGELHRMNTFIPAYVNIALSVAVGLTDGTREDFGKVLTNFDFAAAACRNDCIAGKQEIIVFPQTPSESDYEFIVPVMHINVTQSDDWRADYDGYVKSVPCFQRTRTAKKHRYAYLTLARLPPPTGQSASARHHQTHAPLSQPPIPARLPTARRTTPAGNTPIDRQKVAFPENSMAAVVAELKKLNVSDNSARNAVARTPVAAISSQPTVPLASSSGVSKTPSSSKAAYSRSVLPARSASRRLAVPPSRRPNDGRTPKLGSVSLTGSTATAIGYQDDDILSRDVHCLSTEDVSGCLTLLKMSEHVDDFVDKDVDGEMLSCLDETILIDEFRFSRFNAKKLMKFVTEGYIPRTGSLPTTSVSNV